MRGGTAGAARAGETSRYRQQGPGEAAGPRGPAPEVSRQLPSAPLRRLSLARAPRPLLPAGAALSVSLAIALAGRRAGGGRERSRRGGSVRAEVSARRRAGGGGAYIKAGPRRGGSVRKAIRGGRAAAPARSPGQRI